MLVRNHTGLLIAVGLHQAVPEPVLSGIHDHLLATGQGINDPESRVTLVQKEVWRLHEAGLFYQYVPELMVACASGESLVTWSTGPNGFAVVDSDGIRTVGDDLRYASLSRLGVDTTTLRPPELSTESPADEVSGLTQLDPEVAMNQIAHVERSQTAVLLSRGALPFGTHQKPLDVHQWWELECGWRHGMAADLIVLTIDAQKGMGNFLISAFKSKCS